MDLRNILPRNIFIPTADRMKRVADCSSCAKLERLNILREIENKYITRERLSYADLSPQSTMLMMIDLFISNILYVVSTSL